MVIQFSRPQRLEAALFGCIFALLICVTGFLNVNNHFSTAVRSDGRGYYVYLPALFIHHDLTMRWTEPLQKQDPWYPGTGEWYGLLKVSDHTYLDKYPIGLAVLWTPFFLLAHIFSIVTGKSTTGYSGWYQGVISLAGVVYTALGCLILFKVLRRYFSTRISYFVVLTLLLGTNLLSYATYDNDFTHVYSFCLVAAALYLLPLWYHSMTYRISLLMAVLLALIVLIRQTDALFLVVVALWGVTSRVSLRQRVELWRREWQKLVAMTGAGLLVVFPQLLYWHAVDGKWLLFSYQGEGFNFWRPQLFDILFSSDRGVFFWAPVLLLSLAGFVLMWHHLKEWFWPMVAFFPVWLWIIASWHSWQFGVSYGHRAFIDFFPLLAIAIGLVYSRARSRQSQRMLAAIVIICVVMNLFLTYAYWVGGVPGATTTVHQYLAIWRHELTAVLYKGFNTGALGLSALVLLTLGPLTHYVLNGKEQTTKLRKRRGTAAIH